MSSCIMNAQKRLLNMNWQSFYLLHPVWRYVVALWFWCYVWLLLLYFKVNPSIISMSFMVILRTNACSSTDKRLVCSFIIR